VASIPWSIVQVEKQSFVDLMEMWYLDVVAPRLPEAKIRDEFKLSKRTVLNYQQRIKNLGRVAKNLLVAELNEKSAQGLVGLSCNSYIYDYIIG
jgi:hypothetical protein